MQYESIDGLRERHAAWRLLRAGNSTLILSFLGDFFVDGNRGACAASEVAAALDDHLYALNDAISTPSGDVRFPKEPRAYLEDWTAADSGYLRRFYPPHDDEAHYEVTPAFEKSAGSRGLQMQRSSTGATSTLTDLEFWIGCERGFRRPARY